MSLQALLIATPDAPVPEGAAAEWVRGAGGARLRAALFPAKGPARGSVVLSGGRTEPIEKYFEVIGELQARGFVVLAHDWRGQGLSHRALPDRLKGHAAGYDEFLADFAALLDAFEARLPKPWIALGHSMGGCLTLLALAHGQAQRFAGCALSAPMLGILTGGVSPGAARLLARVNCLFGRSGRYTLGQPGKPFDDAFEGNALTHDPARFARHRAQIAACPDLALGAPTWGWLDFAFRAMGYLGRPERLAKVSIPVVICSAQEDKLVDNAAQRSVTDRLPRARFVEVKGALHEILMETDERRAVFWDAFDALADEVAPKPVAQARRATSPSA